METGDGSDIFQSFHISGVNYSRTFNRRRLVYASSFVVMGQLKSLVIQITKAKLGLSCPRKDFCQSCNRLRVSSLGNLHFYVYLVKMVFTLRDLLGADDQNEALKARIQRGLQP